MKITAHFHGPGSSENPTMFGFVWKITVKALDGSDIALAGGVESTRAEMYRAAGKALLELQFEVANLTQLVEEKARGSTQ